MRSSESDRARKRVTKDRYIKVFGPGSPGANEENGNDLGCHECLCTNCAPH